ncbi:EAL domain-containing protein [Aliikangiella sp. G2MR2-5]|uniref:sensor domain-containing protein n=1 Tax=Aliikangiella sp. G2MR2-5 TaxID=2788943 RepID=UPI0018A90814|nr:EAL domain-containing protein [Aliikangiella sp. G2MR2-5]
MQQANTSESFQNIQHQKFEQVLKKLLAALSGRLGEKFLHALVENFCEILKLDYSSIGIFESEDKLNIKTLAVFAGKKAQNNFSYSLAGTPCDASIKSGVCCITNSVQENFPEDKDLSKMEAESYIGVVLRDSKGKPIGVLNGISTQEINNATLLTSIFQVFAFRVAAELERQSITRHLEDEVLINQAQLDSVPALMFMIDREGQFLRWNRYFSSKFGYSTDKMKNKDIFGAVHESDRKRLKLELENVFNDGEGTVYLNGITHAGEVVPLLATVQIAEYEGKSVIVGVGLDMTEQQSVERNLLRSQGRLARKNSQLSLINTLVEKLHEGHSVRHIAQEIVSLLRVINDGALVFFSVVRGQELEIIASSGADQRTVNARRIFPLGQVDSPTSTAVRNRKLEVFRQAEHDTRINEDIRKLIVHEGVKSGIVIPLIYADKALGGVTIGFRYESDFRQDELEFYQTIGTSISLALSNARQFELMETLATYDNLTRLPNRNALNDDCATMISASRKSEHFWGLVLVDLDRFKEINDTLDHQIGDKLLQLIGPRIKAAINDEQAKIYRLGGDEFCVLAGYKVHPEEIGAIGEMIDIAIAEPFVVDGLNLEISSSIGVVTSLGDQRTPAEMLRCAELAMYHAKNSGGGITEYTHELDADTDQRFVIMAEMAEAIRNDDLVLHYQPKFDLATRRIIGCEALVRWQHQKYGLIPPARFIPLVELTQLIHPLTFWVMKNAMAQIQRWKKEGIEINVAINLSTRNLADTNFIFQLDSLLGEYDVSPGEFEFEFTETALMSNADEAQAQLKAFKARGIKCSLDDYGTGYSSLTYIKKLPLDILKIDRSFISRLTEDSADRIIAQSTINLAHSLGMQVVAEGVENENTMHELARQGCDFIQGYYISEPLDAESFAKLYWEHETN